MNRLEMATRISERVPVLAKRDESGWKEAERLRKQFVTDYPINKIGHLSIDEYVIGKGSTNPSFCYRLERELDSLGRILGATAYKFGVYYGKTKSDASMKYRFVMHWGGDKTEAFEAVKLSIVTLLQAVAKDDMEAIRENKISPMFKGKLLFIYYPEKFAPIYAKQHLEHFLAQLNISGVFESEPDMQRALMGYRESWKELQKQHACLYMRFLYDEFGFPDYQGSTSSSGKESSANAPLLSEAIKGASFINGMPAITGTTTPQPGTGKGDYLGQQKHLKRIGDRGEAIVLAMEKQRLAAERRSDLSAKVKYIAEQDDRAGFDILSFDNDGTVRPIEVKATSGNTLERGFYITANEVEQASKQKNYHIYFVFSAMSKHPQVLQMKDPLLNGGDFELKAIAYHGTLK